MFCFRNMKVNFRYALLTKVLEECVTEKNLISQPKNMLCVVLKRTISMRHFFYATKTYAKNMGKKIFTILHYFFFAVHLCLCETLNTLIISNFFSYGLAQIPLSCNSR